tara:strand:+ start:148 stop:492 length:345 start_codon:yes stop_codon:yes gene_type:complete
MSEIKVGTLLRGIEIPADLQNDYRVWYDFPRYEVVAIDTKRNRIVASTLDSSGKFEEGYVDFPIGSDLFEIWTNRDLLELYAILHAELKTCLHKWEVEELANAILKAGFTKNKK